MSKEEYLGELREKLTQNNIPGIDAMIEFYDEAISDRVEEGMSEEEAVGSMEETDSIVRAAMLDKPITALMANKVRDKHNEARRSGHGTLFVVLAVVGFPIWFSLLVAFAAVIFSLYVAMWSVVISLYAVELSFAVGSLASLLGSLTVFMGEIPFATALALIGCACFLAGLSILLWKPIVAITKGMIKLFKAVFRSIKSMFVK